MKSCRVHCLALKWLVRICVSSSLRRPLWLITSRLLRDSRLDGTVKKWTTAEGAKSIRLHIARAEGSISIFPTLPISGGSSKQKFRSIHIGGLERQHVSLTAKNAWLLNDMLMLCPPSVLVPRGFYITLSLSIPRRYRYTLRFSCTSAFQSSVRQEMHYVIDFESSVRPLIAPLLQTSGVPLCSAPNPR